ncbi:MAG: bifunctional DNA-formamidopyrimidine glycosylase/DNA-(apurinic or apyrimidinic site) lyase [Rhodobacterales bacterium]
MPELPEVETVRRGLEPVMTGLVITHADVRRPDLRWPFPERMAERLTGQQVLQLRRRSKYILVDLASRETLIIHLGMSGRMLISRPEGQQTLGEFHHTMPVPEKHDHVVLDMDNGARITFNDARRFGAMDLCATDAVEDHKLLRDIGPEPLGNSFDAAYLAAALKTRNAPIKTTLLDQKLVAGLGNIYVCEVLWRAKVSPLRLAKDVSVRKSIELVPVIRDVLTEAIESGGSSLKDYKQTDGELGYFQHSFAAYGRAGEACKTPDCKGIVKRIVQAGRSTFYCPKCQT